MTVEGDDQVRAGPTTATPAIQPAIAGPGEKRRLRLAGEFSRFAIVGGVNTVVAYASYLLLLRWMRYELAYSIAYAAGIATAYVLSARFVFRQPLRRRSATRFPAVYIAQFLISLGVLKLAVELFGMPRWTGMAVAILLTMPVTFVLSRWIVRSG